MKKYLKFLAIFLILFSISSLISSCEKDEEDEKEVPGIDRGPTEANRVVLIFSRIAGSTTVFEDSAQIYDPDGMGGNAPIVLDTLVISKVNSSNAPIIYDARAEFYLDGTNVNGIINSHKEDFIVCFRKFQTQELQLRSRDLDGNDVFLGLKSEWNTQTSSTSGNGIIYLTLSYQKLAKDGLCDAGVKIFEYNLPYRLK